MVAVLESGSIASINRDWQRRARVEVRRNWWVVVASGLLFAGIALVVSLLGTPVYSAQATMYVTSSGDQSGSSSAYQGSLASQQRVASYVRLISSDVVVSRALRESNLDMSEAQARDSLSAAATPDTVLLTITGHSASSEDAVVLVNSVASAMAEYVSTLETPAGGGPPLAKLTVVSGATSSDTPVSPQIGRNVLLGALVGILIGVLISLARVRFDTKIRSSADVMELVSQDPLAVIPLDSPLSSGRPVDFEQGFTSAGEEYRRLRSRLALADVDGAVRRIFVTSASAGEGKTTTAINLAVALAENGASVVLVGCDLRKPALAKRLGLNEEVGLTTCLAGGLQLEDVVQSSGVSGLHVLDSGPVPPNPGDVLASQRVRQIFDSLSSAYEYVVVDLPPVLPVADPVSVAGLADAFIVVVRANMTSKPDMVKTLRQLGDSRAKVLGVVLNGAESDADGPVSYYY